MLPESFHGLVQNPLPQLQRLPQFRLRQYDHFDQLSYAPNIRFYVDIIAGVHEDTHYLQKDVLRFEKLDTVEVTGQEDLPVQGFQDVKTVGDLVDEQIDGELVDDDLERVVRQTVDEVGNFPILQVLVQEEDSLEGKPWRDVVDGH